MKKITPFIITALLLTSCREASYTQAEMDALKQQQKECETQTEELKTQLDKANRSFKESQDRIAALEKSVTEMEIQRKLVNISMDQHKKEQYNLLFGDDFPNNFTSAFFCGDKSGVLTAVMKEKKSGATEGYGIVTLKDRFAYVKGEKIGRLYDSTGRSNNHDRNSAEFIFEYLGDCVGNNLAFGFDNNYEFTHALVSQFRDEQMDQLVDYVCERITIILDDEWRDNKKQLVQALEFVLETEKSVDYSAEITSNKGGWREIFVNETYEKEWNGVQKFFYRTEKKFPGSAKRIIFNVKKYRDSLS